MDNVMSKMKSTVGQRRKGGWFARWIALGNIPPSAGTVVDGGGNTIGSAHWNAASGAYVMDQEQTIVVLQTSGLDSSPGIRVRDGSGGLLGVVVEVNGAPRYLPDADVLTHPQNFDPATSADLMAPTPCLDEFFTLPRRDEWHRFLNPSTYPGGATHFRLPSQTFYEPKTLATQP